MLKKLVMTTLIITTSACHTVNVQNDEEEFNIVEPTKSETNHTGIFGLVNYSDDFHVSHMCSGKKWQRITTERSGVNVATELGMSVASNVTTGALSSAIQVGNFFWDPITVEWQCGK